MVTLAEGNAEAARHRYKGGTERDGAGFERTPDPVAIPNPTTTIRGSSFT